ncbi:hypothetical protein JCM15765_34840 [Paradesulfitobacterium aromaticivorans]
MKLKGNAIFELFLLVLSVAMFFVSWSYNPRARFIPEILSVVMFILAMLLLLGENVPSLQKRMGFMRQKGFFTNTGSAGKISEQDQGAVTDSGTEKETEPVSESDASLKENLKLVRLLLWLIAFVVMLRFVSYLITVPVWLLLFIKAEGERSWRQSALVAVGMGIFDYVLFTVLLRATF